jgi:hypothetical protein
VYKIKVTVFFDSFFLSCLLFSACYVLGKKFCVVRNVCIMDDIIDIINYIKYSVN